MASYWMRDDLMTARCATECVHHWRIAMPEGPTSAGRCQICGEKREFANAYPFKTYNKAALTLKEQDA